MVNVKQPGSLYGCGKSDDILDQTWLRDTTKKRVNSIADCSSLQKIWTNPVSHPYTVLWIQIWIKKGQLCRWISNWMCNMDFSYERHPIGYVTISQLSSPLWLSFWWCNQVLMWTSCDERWISLWKKRKKTEQLLASWKTQRLKPLLHKQNSQQSCTVEDNELKYMPCGYIRLQSYFKLHYETQPVGIERIFNQYILREMLLSALNSFSLLTTTAGREKDLPRFYSKWSLIWLTAK